VRFEPGQEQTVELVALAGAGRAHGMNGLTEGDVLDPAIRVAALELGRARGFLEAGAPS
jgi:urease subunit beta